MNVLSRDNSILLEGPRHPSLRVGGYSRGCLPHDAPSPRISAKSDAFTYDGRLPPAADPSTMHVDFSGGRDCGSGGNRDRDKVERCPNFSDAEKQRFIELFEENKDILLNNGRKPNLADLKKDVWDKIVAEMNETVSSQLPRTVNQLQTFWKNVSVRTKNKYKDLPPDEYLHLPPLTAKILTLADEASSAYSSSLSSTAHHQYLERRGRGGRAVGPPAAGGRRPKPQPSRHLPSSYLPHDQSNRRQLFDQFVESQGAVDIFHATNTGDSNDEYDSINLADSMENDQLLESCNNSPVEPQSLNGGQFSSENRRSSPEPVPSESTSNDLLNTQIFLEDSNYKCNNNGRRNSSEDSADQKPPMPVMNGFTVTACASGRQQMLGGQPADGDPLSSTGDNKTHAQKRKAVPPTRKNFSWDKLSHLTEKTTAVDEKSRQIELKNRALQTKIEANLAKKAKYDEQAKYYRLKCAEISAGLLFHGNKRSGNAFVNSQKPQR